MPGPKLRILRENQADVENKLRCLPFKTETASQVRNKQVWTDG